MMDFLLSIYNNKLLFYGIIVVTGFVIFSIFLVKRIDKEKTEDDMVDYEKIDGDNSLFDEALKENSEITNSEGKLDLEVMIEKMQKDLDAKASEVVEKFEAEQEEKSVISYQELVGEKTSKMDVLESLTKATEQSETINEINNQDNIINEIDTTQDNVINEINSSEDNKINDYKIDITNFDDSKEDMLSNYDLVNDDKVNLNHEKFENILEFAEEDGFVDDYGYQEIPVQTSNLYQKDDFVNAIKTGEYEEESKGKFKSTDFISPIYGIQDIKMQYPTVQNMKEFRQPAKNYNKFELEQTLNMEPLNDEVRQNEAFLEALKEFRKNLE